MCASCCVSRKCKMQLYRTSNSLENTKQHKLAILTISNLAESLEQSTLKQIEGLPENSGRLYRLYLI